jgi:hypothetical protein
VGFFISVVAMCDSNPQRVRQHEAFGTSIMLDAGPAQLLSGRRSEAPGFGASDESREDWSQRDSQSPWGLLPAALRTRSTGDDEGMRRLLERKRQREDLFFCAAHHF